MILLVDYYDSFVYTLARYVEELGFATCVMRHDDVDESLIENLRPSALILSPGPGAPEDTPTSLDLVRHFGASLPMLGICLGHQIIARAYGARVLRVEPAHGISTALSHDGIGLFTGLPSPLMAARYHSLAIDLPDHTPLMPLACSMDNIIMAFRHRTHPLYGVQFHPESVISEGGHQLLSNFLHETGL
ncbi:MAG: aminodeoxychorismate/anthranilate synthase component II [Parvularculales bacterium]